jgi:putative Mg2+ transporter-C (MgtC) family protein
VREEKLVEITAYIHHLGEVNVYMALGIEIVMAIVLGGLVGHDREKKMKSAGIKTNILICIGATLYTAISLINQKHYMAPGLTVIDPNRMSAQIVSGIGFLGAGAIIQGRGGITGLTTAASIWVVAAIGVTIGSGYPLVATIFTLTMVFVLRNINTFYKKMFEKTDDMQEFHLEILMRGNVQHQLRRIILAEVDDILDVNEEAVEGTNNEKIVNYYIVIHPRRLKGLVESLKGVIRVKEVIPHHVVG